MTWNCDFCRHECVLVTGQLRSKFQHLFWRDVFETSRVGADRPAFDRVWAEVAAANPPLLTALMCDFGMMGDAVMCANCAGISDSVGAR